MVYNSIYVDIHMINAVSLFVYKPIRRYMEKNQLEYIEPNAFANNPELTIM